MRWLVTGGAGFIGQHVVQQLVRLHGAHNVHVLDARTRAATGWNAVGRALGEQLWLGDVCSPDEMRVAISDARADVVLHLAAQSHVDRSLREPNEAMLVNAYGTQVVATACAAAYTPMVYCSTDEVYGPALMLGRVPTAFSEHAKLHPSSPYSAGKAAGELAVQAMGHSAGLRYAITRGCNAWGTGQLAEKLLPIACTLLNRGEPVPLHGGGQQLRQWVAAPEFAAALVQVGTWLHYGDITSGTMLNIAGPTVCSVRELVLALAEEAGVPAEHALRYAAERPGQDAAYCIDGRKLTELGWEAEADILDPKHLRAMLAHYGSETPIHLAPFVESIHASK